MYRLLDSERILQTARGLRGRISERFPTSGLSGVAGEVVLAGDETAEFSRWLARPIRTIRVLVALTIGLMLVISAAVLLALDRRVALFTSVAELLQGLDAAVNEIILMGVALFFLLSWEGRIKRHRALKSLHQLRSLAHVVDMHQLTKDPERVAHHGEGDTESSPSRTMTPFQLLRYLDYCSELLSLISKMAALYVQEFDDPVTLNAVGDVQALCAGLSQKIWQKIMILDRVIAAT